MEIGSVSCIAHGKACQSGTTFIVHILKMSVVLSTESIRYLCGVTFQTKPPHNYKWLVCTHIIQIIEKYKCPQKILINRFIECLEGTL